MTKMHQNELETDENLVRALLESQCSEWANMTIIAVKSSGTDNALTTLARRMIENITRDL